VSAFRGGSFPSVTTHPYTPPPEGILMLCGASSSSMEAPVKFSKSGAPARI